MQVYVNLRDFVDFVVNQNSSRALIGVGVLVALDFNLNVVIHTGGGAYFISLNIR